VLQEAFREQIEALSQGGVDLIMLETFGSLDELVAAVEAAREVAPELPVVAQMTFLEDGRTLAGESPAEVGARLDGLELAAVGANCTLGPQGLQEVLSELARHTSMPLVAQPNAGSPTFVDGRFQYTADPAYFARYAGRYAQLGAALVGGCCGTTPAHNSSSRGQGHEANGATQWTRRNRRRHPAQRGERSGGAQPVDAESGIQALRGHRRAKPAHGWRRRPGRTRRGSAQRRRLRSGDHRFADQRQGPGQPDEFSGASATRWKGWRPY
jgi:homocysteine S-methyltransferase